MLAFRLKSSRSSSESHPHDDKATENIRSAEASRLAPHVGHYRGRLSDRNDPHHKQNQRNHGQDQDFHCGCVSYGRVGRHLPSRCYWNREVSMAASVAPSITLLSAYRTSLQRSAPLAHATVSKLTRTELNSERSLSTRENPNVQIGLYVENPPLAVIKRQQQLEIDQGRYFFYGRMHRNRWHAFDVTSESGERQPLGFVGPADPGAQNSCALHPLAIPPRAATMAVFPASEGRRWKRSC